MNRYSHLHNALNIACLICLLLIMSVKIVKKLLNVEFIVGKVAFLNH